MPASPALLMEVEGDSIARIPGLTGPNLDAGTGIPREDGGSKAIIVRAINIIRLIERSISCMGHGDRLLIRRNGSIQEFVRRRYAMPLFDQVRVDEEELNVALGEGLLD